MFLFLVGFAFVLSTSDISPTHPAVCVLSCIEANCTVLGTGIYMSNFLVVTARHVLEAKSKSEHAFYVSKNISAGKFLVLQYQCADIDICALYLEAGYRKDWVVAQTSTKQASAGYLVHTWGYPKDLQNLYVKNFTSGNVQTIYFTNPILTTGHVAAVDTNIPVFGIDMNVHEGNSGGPLMYGNVVLGMITEKMTSDLATNRTLLLEYIRSTNICMRKIGCGELLLFWEKIANYLIEFHSSYTQAIHMSHIVKFLSEVSLKE